MRIKRKKVSNTYIKSKLSLEAKGLMCFLLEIPKINNLYDDVMRYNVVVKDKIDMVLNELVDAGYYDKDTQTLSEIPIKESSAYIISEYDEEPIKPLIGLTEAYNGFIVDIKDFQKRWNAVSKKRKSIPQMRSIENKNRKRGWKKAFEIYPYSDKEFWNLFFENLDTDECENLAKQVYNGRKYFKPDYFIRENKFERIEELVNGTLCVKEKSKGIQSTFVSKDNKYFDKIKTNINIIKA